MVVLFNALPNEQWEMFCRQVESLSGIGPVERHADWDGLKSRLRAFTGSIRWLVLMAENEGRLTGLLADAHLLQDYNLLLVLPTSRPDWVRAGHRLRPRLITALEWGLGDLIAVLAHAAAHEAPAAVKKETSATY